MLRREFLKKTGMVMAGLAVAPQLILEIQPPIYNDFNGVLTRKDFMEWLVEWQAWDPHNHVHTSQQELRKLVHRWSKELTK